MTIIATTTQTGWKIKRFGELAGWKTARMSEFDWEHWAESCPSHGAEMPFVARIIDDNDEVPIWCCSHCGLVGYDLHPSPESLANYYANEWMGETVEQALRKVPKHAQPDWPVELLRIPKDSNLLDIGCGYGDRLVAWRQAGHENVFGTEQCTARAEACRAAGFNIINDGIEGQQYQLISMHHVLEHLADPATTLQLCAASQPLGGYLQISVPRFEWEPSMGVILFLPHLWSFTSEALDTLVIRAGYRPVRDDSTKANLSKIYMRCVPDLTPIVREDAVERCIAKLRRGLGLPTPQTLTWERNRDGTLSDAYRAGPVVERTVEVEPVSEFLTDAPIEIQFEDEITFLCK